LGKREQQTTDKPKEDATPAALAPNVKLAGEAEPLGAGPVTVGMATIGELPDEAQQRAGFYFPAAQRLIRLFPDRFKLIVEKGNS
jgi:hypothetical protein